MRQQHTELLVVKDVECGLQLLLNRLAQVDWFGLGAKDHDARGKPEVEGSGMAVATTRLCWPVDKVGRIMPRGFSSDGRGRC